MNVFTLSCCWKNEIKYARMKLSQIFEEGIFLPHRQQHLSCTDCIQMMKVPENVWLLKLTLSSRPELKKSSLCKYIIYVMKESVLGLAVNLLHDAKNKP